MNPENLNRAAMWGTIAILVIASAVFASRWASGNSDVSETAQGIAPVQVSDAFPTPEGNTPTAASRSAEPRPETTTPRPLESIVLDATLETVAPSTPGVTDPSTPSTTEPAAVVDVPGTGTTTTLPAAPTTTTTTTVPVSTTTTTTVPVSSTTTTTVPVTTTTTTVASAVPGIFLKKLEGRAQPGDGDEWTVRIDITLDGTVDGDYSGQVSISWAGGAGSSVLTTAKNGKARATVGPFSGSSVTLSVTNVRATDWVYVPSLNQAPSSLSIAAPGG
jgi:hypothetical protein